jgi:hypothetical protein
MPYLLLSILKLQLVCCTFVGLTVAKSKPLVLPMPWFSLSNTTYIWIYMIYD